MAVKSKINPEDAQEWLATLGQTGEGWWRQVALAVRMGAPKALGMDRREFVQQIGVRMGTSQVERDDAIRELHAEGMSAEAIADVLGLNPHSVRDVVAGRRYGHTELESKRKQARVSEALPPGKPAVSEENGSAVDLDKENAELKAAVEKLAKQAEDEQKRADEAKADAEAAELQREEAEDAYAELVKGQKKKALREAVKEAKKEAAKTDEERQQEYRDDQRKQAEGQALEDAFNASGQRMATVASVAGAVVCLDEACENLVQLSNGGAARGQRAHPRVAEGGHRRCKAGRGRMTKGGPMASLTQWGRPDRWLTTASRKKAGRSPTPSMRRRRASCRTRHRPRSARSRRLSAATLRAGSSGTVDRVKVRVPKTDHVIYRRPGTRGPSSVWHVGCRAADVGSRVRAHVDDQMLRVLRALRADWSTCGT